MVGQLTSDAGEVKVWWKDVSGDDSREMMGGKAMAGFEGKDENLAQNSCFWQRQGDKPFL